MSSQIYRPATITSFFMQRKETIFTHLVVLLLFYSVSFLPATIARVSIFVFYLTIQNLGKRNCIMKRIVDVLPPLGCITSTYISPPGGSGTSFFRRLFIIRAYFIQSGNESYMLTLRSSTDCIRKIGQHDFP